MPQTRCADAALLLAIDASGSVRCVEFTLRQQGCAAAFLSAKVRTALSDAGVFDVGTVLFTDTERDLHMMPMTRIV